MDCSGHCRKGYRIVRLRFHHPGEYWRESYRGGRREDEIERASKERSVLGAKVKTSTGDMSVVICAEKGKRNHGSSGRSEWKGGHYRGSEAKGDVSEGSEKTCSYTCIPYNGSPGVFRRLEKRRGGPDAVAEKLGSIGGREPSIVIATGSLTTEQRNRRVGRREVLYKGKLN